MNAWQLPALGSIDNLKLVRGLPDPTPAAGEVVLQVEFAALNPADRYLAEKQYPAKPSLPHVLGRDGVGTVVSIGAGVGGIEVGDVKAILRGETGVKFALVWDQGQAAASVYKPATMPTSYLIDRAGLVKFVHEGFHSGDEADLEQRIRSLV